MSNAHHKQKLTKTLLDDLQPAAKEYSVWDTLVEGFHVRVSPAGRRTLSVYYRSKRGIGRRRSLGCFPTVKVEEARDAARGHVAAAKQGHDPFGDRDAQRAIPKLKDFWTIYWEEHALPKKAARSSEQDELLWRKHLAPAFGETFVDQIDVAAVRRWHGKMKATPGAANRSLSLLSKMMSMCIASGYMNTNPCQHTIKFPEKQRDPDLGPDDVEELWSSAVHEEENGDRGAARVVMLILLTGARRFEALNARWRDVDLGLSDPRWRVPIEHIKGGERSQITITRNLSADAALLLASWKPAQCNLNDLVFPSPKNPSEPRFDIKKPWDRIRCKAGRPDLRLHDLRHLFATLAIGEGHSLDEIGDTLGHRCPTTTRRYAHIVSRQKSRVANSVSSIVLRREREAEPVV